MFETINQSGNASTKLLVLFLVSKAKIGKSHSIYLAWGKTFLQQNTNNPDLKSVAMRN